MNVGILHLWRSLRAALDGCKFTSSLFDWQHINNTNFKPVLNWIDHNSTKLEASVVYTGYAFKSVAVLLKAHFMKSVTFVETDLEHLCKQWPILNFGCLLIF